MTRLLQKTAPYITQIIDRLQQAGYEAYVVGGAVRDFLLDCEPKDYDISTSATPEQVKKVFRDHHCIIIGRRFRLVHLYHKKDDIIEISTFRRCPDEKEQLERPAKAMNAPEHMIFHDNDFGTAEDDAHRRDFTVNALFYDPVHDKILDYTGYGQADIQARIVRCIGEPALRFEEDPVRMLRALKLVGQYGFTLEPKTEDALRNCLPLIVHASVSRLTLEFEKILKNPHGDAIISTFRKYGLLRYFMPVLDQAWNSPEGKYLMALWAKRNEHIRAGTYYASMSMMLSLFALPFVEKRFGNAPGELWQVIPDMEDIFHSQILAVIKPHSAMRVKTFHAVNNLILQPRFFHRDVKNYNLPRASYSNARELAAIQNEVSWHFDDFDEACPKEQERKPPQPGEEAPEGFRKRRRRHRHRSHGGGKPAASETAAEPTGEEGL